MKLSFYQYLGITLLMKGNVKVSATNGTVIFYLASKKSSFFSELGIILIRCEKYWIYVLEGSSSRASVVESKWIIFFGSFFYFPRGRSFMKSLITVPCSSRGYFTMDSRRSWQRGRRTGNAARGDGQCALCWLPVRGPGGVGPKRWGTENESKGARGGGVGGRLGPRGRHTGTGFPRSWASARRARTNRSFCCSVARLLGCSVARLLRFA